MPSDIFIYIVLMSVAGVLNIFIGIYAYAKRRSFLGSQTFIFISFFSSIYTFGHAFELSSQSLDMIVLWTYFQYLGLPYIAPLSLMLVLQYIRKDKYLTTRNRFFLLLIPIITTMLVLTNHLHHQFYQTVYLRNDVIPMIDFVIGPWYIVHGSYTFGCLLAGGVLLLSYWKQTKSTYWKQIFVLLLGLYLPMISSFLYLLGYTPYGMDPVPIVMSVTSFLYIWAFMSTNILELAPIARGLIFDSMRDGVLVLDPSQRIVDFNDAAKKIIGDKLNDKKIGENIHSLWQENELNTFLFPSIDHLNHKEEFELEWSGLNSYYQIRSTPVKKKSGFIVGSTIVIADITEQRQLYQKLERLAYTDGLTGILNRKTFIDRSDTIIKEMHKEGISSSLIIFDIDHFKAINDKYGHRMGDEAICHVVSICQRFLQPSDLFGRYGGEEFVICLPSTTLHEAGEYAEAIRRSIENTPFERENKKIPITASFGVTHANKDIVIEDLLSYADKALYKSKHSGRNTVHLAQTNRVYHRGDQLLIKT
ncbi:diguanylate cyclase (GGDEF)-like protein/PAS domain S-box-containing protein [Metabacillus crassostreae]|uniref:histidine kinase N-terminal 7TM domain-containing diguanylate cyclase n=1 Tax=Metabacillus crassostreae TaxID=929098 RepID=UPI00195AF7A5|nr:histidine kinase N-terminal 7TM domain-containing protein [Metabacillus crassostreae]MBM7605507.1 diguanylate cyclase (GGDEF)-like protein/PAS domain S-box-containing protein [Metabacillus crassostreae]